MTWHTAGENSNFLSAALRDPHGRGLDENWLNELASSYRSDLQISAPIPVSSSSAGEAANKVFALLVSDPEVKYRSSGGAPVRTRPRKAYHALPLGSETFLEHVSVEVEGKKEVESDFAVANGHVVQLAAAWSFNMKTEDGTAGGNGCSNLGIFRGPYS